MRAILISAALAVAAISAPLTAEAIAKHYNLSIPRQSLDSALKDFAQQTGLQVARLVGNETSDVSVGPLSGEFSAEDALKVLLAPGGLTYRVVNERTIAVVDAPKQPDEAASASRVRNPQAGPHSNVASESQNIDAESSRAELKGELAEIVVTAQKRAERLIDTPQSVTVLSSDELTRLGATQFRDFANTVPGLNFTTAGAGNTQISLRGVTTGFDVSPTTATYIDEVPYGSSTAFANSAQLGLDPALFGLERIEVLRGPQGTIYGASAMGGLIKYVSRMPDTKHFRVEAQTGISSTSDGGVGYNGNASVNAPIVADKVALRASAFESHDGGYIDNFARSRDDANRSDVYGGRADLLLVPTGALTVRLTAFLQNIARDGDGTADYTFTGGQPYGTLGQSRPAAEPFDQRFRVFSGAVTYDIGAATLTSISSYQSVRSQLVWDLSSIYVPFLASSFGRSYSSTGIPVDSRTKKFTQEVRLTSAANRSLEWLVGVFYTHETSSLEEHFDLRDLAGRPAPNDLFTFFVPSRYEEYAGFGDLTWHLSDAFDVTAGLRYARNRQEFSQTGAGIFGLSAPTNRATDDVFTYLANARYRFSDHATGYVRYATGYRPGGPAYVTLDPDTGLPNGPSTFEADRLRSYEVGYKAETVGRRFGVDVATYYVDWSDMQVSFNNNGFTSVHNAPGAKIQGIELALTARPVRAFTLGSAFAWQDAKVSEADVALGANKDERLPNVPRFSGALNADYELPIGTWRPTVGASLRYVSDRKSGFGSGAYQLPDYTTVDLRSGASLGSVDVQLYIHNLLDEHGQLSVAYPQFGGRVAILQPRTVGITATTSF